MEDSDKSRLELFTKLNEAIENGSEPQTIIEIAGEIKDLGAESDNLIIENVINVAKIHDGKSHEVLSKLEKSKSDNPFFYVYALHSSGKQEEALDKFNELGLSQSEYYSGLLYSQILYKLDQKEKAAEVLEEIIKSNDEHLENDLNEILTNLLASYTNTPGITEEKIKEIDEKITGEVNSDFVFNSAAASAGINGQEKIASKKLKESYGIAKGNQEENNNKYPVLSSYLAAKIISQTINANDFDWDSLKLSEGDAQSLKLIENEVAYINNLTIIKRKLGLKDNASSLSSKIGNALKSKDINEHQKEVFTTNAASLSAKKGKGSQENQFEAGTIESALFEAQNQISEAKFQEAIKSLIDFMNTNNKVNSRVLTFLLKAAIDNKFHDEKSTITDFIIKNSGDLSKEFLVTVGQILIESQDFLTALQILDKVKDTTEDLKIKAGYLSALSEKDTKAASEYLETLNVNIPELDTEEDLHDIMEAPLLKQGGGKKREKKQEDKVEETKKGGKIFIPKAKKKGKIKYPKNYDPENPGPMPDPERWLPKWQRSKGRKKLMRMKGPQGDAANIGKVNKKDVSTANIEVAGGGKRRR